MSRPLKWAATVTAVIMALLVCAVGTIALVAQISDAGHPLLGCLGAATLWLFCVLFAAAYADEHLS